jgi:hypothetical protein
MWHFPDKEIKEWVWMKLPHIIHLGQDGRSTTIRWHGSSGYLFRLVVVHPDIHMVLTVCGFANVADHTLIINNEGFQSIVGFGVLEDKDVFEMVKHLGGHMVNTFGWTWIEPYNATKNGCGAFLAWADHYKGHGSGGTEVVDCVTVCK